MSLVIFYFPKLQDYYYITNVTFFVFFSYYQLNVDQTLAENLSGKCIVEYPIIYVVKCENSEKYKVVPSPIPGKDLDINMAL